MALVSKNTLLMRVQNHVIVQMIALLFLLLVVVLVLLLVVSHSLPREVFKAKHRQTGKKVALKKVLMENEKEGVRDHSYAIAIDHFIF